MGSKILPMNWGYRRKHAALLTENKKAAGFMLRPLNKSRMFTSHYSLSNPANKNA